MCIRCSKNGYDYIYYDADIDAFLCLCKKCRDKAMKRKELKNKEMVVFN